MRVDLRRRVEANKSGNAQVVAVIAAVVGILLTLSVAFLPVTTVAASLTWPQSGSTENVSAPLVGYTPTSFDAAIPCSTATELANSGGGVLVSTMPAAAPDAARYGLVARATGTDVEQGARVQVILRNMVLLDAPVPTLTSTDCAITIHSTPESSTVKVQGLAADEQTRSGDFRPQLVGVFSDVTGPPPPGLTVHADIDSRFSSSPTTMKFLAMIAGIVFTIVALIALHRLDTLDGRRARRFLPARWWRLGALDVVVIGTLLLWHVIGANTSDDGYQLGMARTSINAGYMNNYFRYFGVPETPFGTPYYDILAWMSTVSTASIWMRLPALAAGIATWLVISREVAPRLGRIVRGNAVAMWSGALVFLAFWLTYNNGLRPEPIVALGVLLTWCSLERAIATKRLAPAAVAILVAALTVTAGPSGLICFAALVAGARPIVRIVASKATQVGYAPVLGPLIASGTVVLVAVFADQPFATVNAMQTAHTAAGPNVPWFDEYLRYQYLFQATVDGSLSRRFGVFVMIAAIVLITVMMLRRAGRVPGTSLGPSRRIVGITVGALLLMMFTPTKWTHHFGVFAGLAGSLAVLLAIAVSPQVVRSRRNLALFGSGMSFLMAFTFTGPNGYWYVASYGVPWWDKAPSINGHGAATAFLGLGVALLLTAAWFHVRNPHPENTSTPLGRAWRLSPLAVAAALVVLLEVLSMAKAALSQYPAYSITRSNLDSMTGNTCALANDVLVEPDATASLLEPITDIPADRALSGDTTTGFTPNGVAGDLSSDEEQSAAGTANTVASPDGTTSTSTNSAGTGGGSGLAGTNGSSVALPFGLDPARTPVLGSFGTREPAALTTTWYSLPASRGDLVSIAVAGRVRSIDADGVETYGQNVRVEYGIEAPDGSIHVAGSVLPLDVGPAPSWRNLRVPMTDIATEANAVRIVVTDNDLDPEQWVALTPPRVPRTVALNALVGAETPVLLDWAVGMNFPCQRPFDQRYGVAEIPRYRILPDRAGAISTNLWQDHFGGGPLGWLDQLQTTQTLPSYLVNDFGRDWGQIEMYAPITTSVPATIDTESVTRSALWSPGPIRTS